MILLIDNYDSFSYNLYQLFGSLGSKMKVIRNDELSVSEIELLAPERIVISPGPGKPADAGVCIETIKHFAGKIPILGVCLGHQAICEAFGSTVSYAKEIMHGKSSMVTLDTDNPLFEGLPSMIKVARYHSLAVVENTLTDELKVLAKTVDGEIMAVSHKTHPVYGVQFHPESILTPEGINIIKNFLRQ